MFKKEREIPLHYFDDNPSIEPNHWIDHGFTRLIRVSNEKTEITSIGYDISTIQ